MKEIGVGDWVRGWWEGCCGCGDQFAADGGEKGKGFANLGVEVLRCLAEREDFGVVRLVGKYCSRALAVIM